MRLRWVTGCGQRLPAGGSLPRWHVPAGRVCCAWEGHGDDFLPSATLVVSWQAWKDTSGPCGWGQGAWGLHRDRPKGGLGVDCRWEQSRVPSVGALGGIGVARHPHTIDTEIMTFAAATIQYVARWTHKTIHFHRTLKGGKEKMKERTTCPQATRLAGRGFKSYSRLKF